MQAEKTVNIPGKHNQDGGKMCAFYQHEVVGNPIAMIHRVQRPDPQHEGRQAELRNDDVVEIVGVDSLKPAGAFDPGKYLPGPRVLISRSVHAGGELVAGDEVVVWKPDALDSNLRHLTRWAVRESRLIRERNELRLCDRRLQLCRHRRFEQNGSEARAIQ